MNSGQRIWVGRWCLLLLLVAGLGRGASAEYASDDYYLDEAIVQPFGGVTDSDQYGAAVGGEVGFTGNESAQSYLGVGGREQTVLPTPPAPLLSPASSETTLLSIIQRGDNDPAVQLQFLLIDSEGETRFIGPSGAAVAANESWSAYQQWGGSAGVIINDLSPSKRYASQVRFKLDDYSVSAWSNSSALVQPAQQTGNQGEVIPSLTTTIGQAVKEALNRPVIKNIVQSIAVVLAPLTALAIATQLSTIGTVIFQLIAELLNRLLSSVLSGLQFFAFYKRRKVFGRVIDGKTREPVVGAVITLLRPDTGRVLDTQSTDKDGRYYFLFDERTSYQLNVTADRFEPFTKTIRGNVNFLIKLGVKLEYDVLELNRRRQMINLVEKINSWRTGLLAVGVVAWILIFTVNPVAWSTYALGGYYVVALIFELYVRRQPRPYGIVEDQTTGQALAMVVVRILDQAGALVETLIGDERGRFRTLLRPGHYQFSFAKQGYQPITLPDVNISQSIHSLAVTAKLQPNPTFQPV